MADKKPAARQPRTATAAAPAPAKKAAAPPAQRPRIRKDLEIPKVPKPPEAEAPVFEAEPDRPAIPMGVGDFVGVGVSHLQRGDDVYAVDETTGRITKKLA